ncbi:MAG: YitT family protein, partial [Bacteroidales bacterium]|nr:YitT family protein [Bacteroidales bacterium]MCF0178249.1 YitT family protein [Bacteroidales bacterium]
MKESIATKFKSNYLNKDFLKSLVYIIVGCFIFSVGAVLFIEPYGFAPGGTYGIGMVLHHTFGWETEFCALCMDIPLLIIGSLIIGPQFGVKTLFATLITPLWMFIIHRVYGYGAILDPGITDITLMKNQLLSALFGGLLYGLGLGIIFKSRSTSGGSDIIAMILRKYFHLSMGNAMIIVDGAICLSTLLVFKDWSLPLYSVIIIAIFSYVSDR